ncbi:hypothetical protein [Sinomicrobium weinanense]|uniref:Uncharacterized protein n=1 Tax=Sinomicrobium weinanense TaxID=2842200 RepID=A0A926JV35_9FLAO|nr:hypothetical protein [Sinomicrobium weinanense]MBC9797864.1 hypothetical protein [Sinomicrobium weinanense]MBU3122236.1 hypothetical protein [Sinomicrobium weinanense]
MNEEQKIDKITKQIPALKKVPREDRLKVMNRVRKNPVLWAVVVSLFALWLYLFWDEMLALSSVDNPHRMLSAKWIFFQFKKIFWPALVPIMVIAGVISVLKVYIVKRIVKKEYPDNTV